ncbi:hypothetical protein ACWEPB_17145 [Kitasatospora cineracea]
MLAVAVAVAVALAVIGDEGVAAPTGSEQAAVAVRLGDLRQALDVGRQTLAAAAGADAGGALFDPPVAYTRDAALAHLVDRRRGTRQTRVGAPDADVLPPRAQGAVERVDDHALDPQQSTGLGAGVQVAPPGGRKEDSRPRVRTWRWSTVPAGVASSSSSAIRVRLRRPTGAQERPVTRSVQVARPYAAHCSLISTWSAEETGRAPGSVTSTSGPPGRFRSMRQIRGRACRPHPVRPEREAAEPAGRPGHEPAGRPAWRWRSPGRGRNQRRSARSRGSALWDPKQIRMFLQGISSARRETSPSTGSTWPTLQRRALFSQPISTIPAPRACRSHLERARN